MGNYKDSKIQTLARKGNGNFAYLDSHMEAEKVLLREFTQTLYAVADDAYMNVEFNPEMIKSYRLLGFDNKVGALNDTSAVVEGGEIGSGYAMTGIFEIEPASSETVPLGPMASIQLRYRNAGDTLAREMRHNSFYIYHPLPQLDSSFGFSTAVALFGSMLKQSSFTKDITWPALSTLAKKYASPSDILQQEFLALVEQARIYYDTKKSRKRRK
jgi:Ca-activated chloride channel family protein